MTHLSLFFSTHSCCLPPKVSFILSTKGRSWDDFRPKSPLSCSLPTSCILSLLLYSFISSTLLLLLFSALQPSLTAVQRRQWIVFNEQRDVEQRSQRDRATQTATQFPSLIHYLHAGFHLRDDDFYFEASFIFHVAEAACGCIYFDKRHLCFQLGWGIFCTSRINALRWKPVHVAHMTAEQQENKETTLLPLDNSYTFTWAWCCPDFDLQA